MELKEARINAGYTLKRLADAVGTSVAAISRYENGKRSPSANTAKKIGELLDIPWYEIIDNKRTEG